jgi:hypothetical protein
MRLAEVEGLQQECQISERRAANCGIELVTSENEVEARAKGREILAIRHSCCRDLMLAKVTTAIG